MRRLKISSVSILIALFIIIFAGLFTYQQLKTSSGPALIIEQLNIELGEPFTLDAEDWFSKDELETIDINVSESLKTLEVFDIEHIPLGKHPFTLIYNYKDNTYEADVTINVVDTLAPKITVLNDQVEVIVNTEYLDYSLLIEVDDHSWYEIEVLNAADLGTIGQYRTTLVVSDESSNKSEVEIEIHVVVQKDPTLYTPHYVKGLLIVNKKHPIPKDFGDGENKEAYEAFIEFKKTMQANGLDIGDGYSGYRSYEQQVRSYESIVKAYGQEHADKVSARPGHSEHQTGYTFDFTHTDSSLVTKKDEAQYIKENSHHFGFIVRYPEQKEVITGYNHEPWHVRYVGKVAKEIYESGLTLEEYLNVEGGDYFE